MTAVDRKRLRELALAATPGPYFVGSDDAGECGPHANSGLSLVDTGRREDWPIARLCESASAAWIAATDPQTILALLDALDALAERADALHKALRDHVLHGPFDANRDSDAPFVSNGCLHCSASWSPSETENHAESCLAAPSAPSTESAD